MRKGNTIQGASEQSYSERASLINKENSSIQGWLVVAGQQANLAILANLIEIIDIALLYNEWWEALQLFVIARVYCITLYGLPFIW